MLKNGKYFYACNNYPKCKTVFSYKPVREFCPKCNSVMLDTPNGLACSNLNCGKEVNDDLVTCPICKKGHLIKKTATKGKNKGKEFWACDNYPVCKTTFSEEPVKEVCGICGSQMVKKDDRISCTNLNCEKYIK